MFLISLKKKTKKCCQALAIFLVYVYSLYITCGNSSVVERHLAKVDVAGPTPVSRSNLKAVQF